MPEKSAPKEVRDPFTRRIVEWVPGRTRLHAVLMTSGVDPGVVMTYCGTRWVRRKGFRALRCRRCLRAFA